MDNSNSALPFALVSSDGTQYVPILTPVPEEWRKQNFLFLKFLPTSTPIPNVSDYGTQRADTSSNLGSPIPVIEIEVERDTPTTHALGVSELPEVGSYSYGTQVTDANINNVSWSSYYSDSLLSSPSQNGVSQASTNSSFSWMITNPGSGLVLHSPVGEIQMSGTVRKRGQTQDQPGRQRKTVADEEIAVVNEISPPKKRPRESIITQRRNSQKVSSPVEWVQDVIPDTCTTMERLVTANSQGFDAQVQNSVAKFSKKFQTVSTPIASISGGSEKPSRRISIRRRTPLGGD